MGKNVWITGASTGIGKALAIKFANEGWTVAISARRENLLLDLCKVNPNIHSFPLDVSNLEDAKMTFNNIIKKLIDIDLCVFATGIYDPNDEKEINIEKMQEVMKINFFGTVNCIKAIEKNFKDKKKGHISIVSSVAGYGGLPNSSGYGPSKAALINLTESLYFDFKKNNVRVSLISPGFIKTPMTDQNDFPRPMIKPPEFAAEQIYIGLIKKKGFEIHFPKAFTYLLKFLSMLPSSIYFKIVEKGMKKIDY